MLNIKRCHAVELLSCKPKPNLMYAIFLTRGKNSVYFYIFLLKRNWKARVMNDHLTAIRHHILLTYWPMEQQALAPFPPPLSSHQTHTIEFHQRYNCKPKVFNSSEQNKAKRCEEKKNRNRNKTELFRIVKVPRRKDGEGVLWLDGKVRGIWTLCIYKCIYETFAIWHISAMSTSSINNNSNPTCSPSALYSLPQSTPPSPSHSPPPFLCVPTIIVLFSLAFCL